MVHPLSPIIPGRVLGSLLALIPVSAAGAGSGPEVEQLAALDIEELMEIKVTLAARKPQTLAHSAAAVQVITSEDIRRSGAVTLPETLRLVPGLSVAQANSSSWAISARGFNGVFANKMLVLLDGRSIYTARQGGTLGEHAFYRIWGKYFLRDETAQPDGTGAGDDFDMLRGGLRLDWELSSADHLEVQGEVFKNSWGERFQVPSLDPPFTRPVEAQDRSGGGHVRARWSHRLSDRSDWMLQAYYDQIRRHIPEVVGDQRLHVVEADFQQRVGWGERQDLVWGAGYRLYRDDTGGLFFLRFEPVRRTMHFFSAFVQDEIGYGTILLRISTDSLRARLHAYLWGVTMAALGLVALAVGFTFALELTITRPLLSLARAARRITEQEDYSVRAAISRTDEIGTLSDAFNAMLTEIERRQHEAREAASTQQLLASVSGALSESLDYPLTLSQVARLLVHSFADFCIVDVMDEEQRIRRVAAAHADPAKEGIIREFLEDCRPARDSPQPAAQVLRSGAPLVLPDLTDAAVQTHALDAETLRLLQLLGAKSAIAVPLIARGRTLGALTLGSTHPARPYQPASLGVAVELARRCAIALDNARLYREAQEAIHIREEFLSIASHELRTPLTALHLATQRLQRLAQAPPGGGREPDRLLASIHAVEQQGKRLTALVGSLLDVARIEAGKLVLEPQEADLAEIVRKVVEQFGDELEKAGCTVRLTADHPVVGGWDISRLEQVVTNLLSNALKYGAGKL